MTSFRRGHDCTRPVRFGLDHRQGSRSVRRFEEAEAKNPGIHDYSRCGSDHAAPQAGATFPGGTITMSPASHQQPPCEEKSAPQPMKPLTVTRRVNAAPDRVEAIVTDIPRAADHISGITRIEMLTDGPFGPGTRWRETRVMFGRPSTEEIEIVEYVPGRHYVAEARSCGTRYRSTFRWQADGDQTRVSVEFHATPLSFAARLFSPLAGLMARPILRCLEQDLTDLARVAESPDQPAD